MSQGPRTFRDPFLSLYQSMMSDIAKANSPDAALEAADDEAAPKPDEVAAAELVAARTAVAEMRAAGIESKRRSNRTGGHVHSRKHPGLRRARQGPAGREDFRQPGQGQGDRGGVPARVEMRSEVGHHHQ